MNGNANENCCVCGGGVRDGNAGADANADADANAVDQPVDCEGSWSAWGDCSASCGGGKRTRNYSVTKAAANGGQACQFNNGVTQTENCNTQACTEECVGGASYIGPNTDPSKQDAGDYSGCAAYNHSASTKEKCNTSYQMDAQGNYTQCELDTSDNTCKPKATNCKPKLNSNNKPTCKLATWIPHSKAVFDCDCAGFNASTGKEQYKVGKWKGSTRCMERDRAVDCVGSWGAWGDCQNMWWRNKEENIQYYDREKRYWSGL